jgi:rubrerythrin
MTRFDPSLIVTRLIVQRNEHIVYDEAFHEGVNVIRGENSSGKSTILNCIYYGLGGDLADWSETALLCTRVIVEVRFNGSLATLTREISKDTGQPMEIFGGSYTESQSAGRTDWIRYPYRRSASQESFSQAIFRLLGIPEVASDASGNLTIHQILRLLYSDQLSPVEALFRRELRFDSPNLRDAIGRLLCGAYENRLYQNDVLIRDKDREFISLNAELRSLFAVIGKTEHSLTLDWLEGERRNLAEQQKKTQAEIEAAEHEVYSTADADKLTLKSQNDAYATVVRLQAELSRLRGERDALALSAADSANFIRNLEQKISALGDAGLVARHLGDIRFAFCPACLSPVAESEHKETCPLCKASFESGRGSQQ